MLSEHDIAPDFSLTATDGSSFVLSELKGRSILLYFYPKDETPGCTKEACDIRDNFGVIEKKVSVFGVSPDKVSSHKEFISHYSLPFPLLSDPEMVVIRRYGCVNNVGKFIRSTFLINEQGEIIRIWRNVDVNTHIQEILEAIK